MMNCISVIIVGKRQQENAKFEVAPDQYKAGYEYETRVEQFETVLCSKCYNTYQVKRKRSSFNEPDIDTSGKI